MHFRVGSGRYSLGILAGMLLALPFSVTELRAEESPAAPVAGVPAPLAEALGVRFIDGSNSSFILERDGKRYIVDLATRQVEETELKVALVSASVPVQSTTSAGGAQIFSQQCASCHGPTGTGGGGAANLADARSGGIPLQSIINTVTNGKSGTGMQGFASRLSAVQIREVAVYVQSLSAQSARSDIYTPGDDFVYSLPTGRRVARKGLYVNFSHRFAYSPAFQGRGLGDTLLGLDDFTIASFGFRYGVTDRLSVSAYRSPSIINRPIEFMAAYNFLDEYDDQPLNFAVRASIDGQDSFTQNFTGNFEWIVSKSVTNRAQFYAVPTASIGNRRLVTKPGNGLFIPPRNLPSINSFSLGAGMAVNVRPTLAVVAEVIPTLVNAHDLGIFRPSYAFGLQKQVRGHAFTLGFSTGPGTIVAQRAATRATLLSSPSADKPSGLFIGFNLMRRIR